MPGLMFACVLVPCKVVIGMRCMDQAAELVEIDKAETETNRGA